MAGHWESMYHRSQQHMAVAQAAVRVASWSSLRNSESKRYKCVSACIYIFSISILFFFFFFFTKFSILCLKQNWPLSIPNSLLA